MYTINIGGNTGNQFSNVPLKSFEFDIPETGDYVLVFYPAASKNADFVLGLANLQAKSFQTAGISQLMTDKATTASHVYDLSGRQVAQPKKGIYISNGKKVIVK